MIDIYGLSVRMFLGAERDLGRDLASLIVSEAWNYPAKYPGGELFRAVYRPGADKALFMGLCLTQAKLPLLPKLASKGLVPFAKTLLEQIMADPLIPAAKEVLDINTYFTYAPSWDDPLNAFAKYQRMVDDFYNYRQISVPAVPDGSNWHDVRRILRSAMSQQLHGQSDATMP